LTSNFELWQSSEMALVSLGSRGARTQDVFRPVEVLQMVARFTLLCVAVAGSVAPSGCRADCDPVAPGPVDQEATATDARVLLQGGDLVYLRIGDVGGFVETEGGEVVFRLEPSLCWWNTEPCTLYLKRLRLRLKPMDLGSNEDTISLGESTIAVESPVEAAWVNNVYALPLGTRVQSSVEVDGRSSSVMSVLTTATGLRIDYGGTNLVLDGTLPFAFVTDAGGACTEIQGEVAGLVVGVAPWSQKPAM
jgi:hypothetical protein